MHFSVTGMSLGHRILQEMEIWVTLPGKYLCEHEMRRKWPMVDHGKTIFICGYLMRNEAESFLDLEAIAMNCLSEREEYRHWM